MIFKYHGLVFLAVIVLWPWLWGEYATANMATLVLIYGLAALGLNLLSGYCGQIALGQAAFMAVGAYITCLGMLRWNLSFLAALLIAGLVAGLLSLCSGLPSKRLDGFYLAITTLATQFGIEWMLTTFPIFSNYSLVGVLDLPPLTIGNLLINSTVERYYLVLGIVLPMVVVAHNLTRSKIGRAWIAIRHNQQAAISLGIAVWPYKLMAFACSGFYAGIAGALLAFCHLHSLEAGIFNLSLSFKLLAIIIMGGLGSLGGAFWGAAFMVITPLLITRLLAFFGASLGLIAPAEAVASLELIIFGIMIIMFLIFEPRGLSYLWNRLLKISYLRLNKAEQC